MKNIAIWNKDTVEYKKLNLFKCFMDIVIVVNNLPIELSIENTYFDFGQNWSWTTIIVYKLNCDSSLNSYQLLNPADHKSIVFGDADDIMEICQKFKKEFLELYKENK
jgi:hypothetical protein